MNIAMMSAWNTDSGVSVHAELIGREWIRMGHRLHVFSFFTYDFHGTAIVGEDEDYVVRCFTTSTCADRHLDPGPILASDYEIFIAQDLGMLPKDELAKIFRHIRRKASTINVIHDNGPSPDPSFYQFDWDRIVCFDHRYEEFLRKYHPEEKISIIPFPCHPLRRGTRQEARAKLALPRERKILLIFGQRVKEHLALLPLLSEMSSHFPLLLLVVSQKDADGPLGIEGIEMQIRKESPSIEVLYDYLHAADILILHRNQCDGVVVSSAAFQCLGSGCPILASNSNFFETLGDVVVTYSDSREFKESLLDVLHGGERYQRCQRALEGFIKRNSAEAVAKQYIELFQALIEERERSISHQVPRVMGVLDPVSAETNGEKSAALSIPSLRKSETEGCNSIGGFSATAKKEVN
jgi:glycosyltransferase involved in cell wall biosynthesis